MLARSNPAARRRGVTLLEMLIVGALLALLAGITYPSVAAGIDSLRLNTAADSIASFLNAALNHAGSRRVPVMVEISRDGNFLRLSSTEAGWTRRLEMPQGVEVENVQPAPPAPPGYENRLFRLLVYPGASPPGVAVSIVNRRGARRIIRLDPATGAPEIERAVEP